MTTHIALLGALLFAQAQTAITAPQKQTQTIDNKGDSLFTILYPNPGRETVILLHGGPGFPGDLPEVAEVLAPHYQVIVFHQRGTGLSPCRSRDYSMAAYLSDVNAVAAFFGVERFHLFGHSWGGLYAQIYAQEFPERLLSLFLCCPGSGTGDEWRQTEREVMQLNREKCTRREWMYMGINSMLGTMGSDRAYMRLFRQVMRNYNTGFVDLNTLSTEFTLLKAAPINRTRPAIRQYPLLRKQPAPGFPMTLVYGDQDIYQSSKTFVTNRYPTAIVHTIAHCGHIPWLHNPVEYKEILSKHFN